MIDAYVVGDAEVVAKLKEVPQKVQKSLVARMTGITIDLQAYVKTDKLSGQVLKRRTGTLSRNINQRVNESGNQIVGTVGTNVEYAAYHEYGYSGSETVKAHLRAIKQAFGRPIEPRTITVNSFTREVKYPEHSFLRSALRDKTPDIQSRLSDAVHEAIGQ